MSFSRSGSTAPAFSFPIGYGSFTDVNASNAVFTSNVYSSFYHGDGGLLSNVISSIPGSLPNLVVSNSLTTTNVYASNIADQTGTFGTTGQVLTKAVAGTLWAAPTISSQWTTGTGNIYYLSNVGIGTSLVSSNLTVMGNAYVSNALTTTNVYASNIADQTGTFGTTGQVLTKAAAGTLWAAAGGGSSQWTGTVGTPIYYVPQVGIGSSTTPTSNLQVTGNAYVSNALTTTNLFANTLTLNANGTFRASGATSLATVSINSAGQLVPTGAGGGATNTAVGFQAMQNNTTGVNNTAFGTNAMLNNNAVNNTAVGHAAMQANTAGGTNTAVGQGAMQANTTGGQNTAVGQTAMNKNTFGSYNTAVGQGSMVANTTGGNNTAVGVVAMNVNTAGQSNTAVGANAMQLNTTGNNNTAVGQNAMNANTTGQANTAVGQAAMQANTTGQNNTAVGQNAMLNNTTGQNNACLGVNSGSDALVNITTQSNYVVLGNNSTATLYCKTSTINTSDARDKTNVKSIAVGLDYVRKLKPVTFNFDDRGWYPEGQAPDGSKACSIHRLGFLAQDILAAEQELGLPFNHVVNTDFPEKLGIMPTNLIPILVKAIQELEQSLATATANISSLEQSLATVTANISSLQPPSAPANPQSSP